MENNSVNLIYGRNPVKESLKAGKIVRLYVQKDFKDCSILDLAKQIPVIFKSASELDKMSNNGVHQGVCAEVKRFEYSSLDEIIRISNKVNNPIILLLDGINDPHNLGAILRSCDVFGVSGVILPKHNQVLINATVAKTSAGAVNYVPVALVNNLNVAIEKLKENKFWVVSTDGSAETNYNELKYDFPVALVIGSEGNGVSKLVLKNSDYIVKIPMYGKVNSLNASVAAGILLARIKQ